MHKKKRPCVRWEGTAIEEEMGNGVQQMVPGGMDTLVVQDFLHTGGVENYNDIQAQGMVYNSKSLGRVFEWY